MGRPWKLGEQWTPDELKAARARLVKLYPDARRVRRVLSDLGFDDGRFNYEGAIVDVWFEALQQLVNQEGCVEKVLDYAEREFASVVEAGGAERAPTATVATSQWTFAEVDLGISEIAPGEYNRPLLYGICGGGDELWIVGAQGVVLHFDGELWSLERQASGNALRAVTCSAPGEILAAGFDGVLRHERDWQLVPGSPTSINATWCAGPSEAWFVGEDGCIACWKAGALTRMTSGTDRPLNAIWGSGTDDIWAAGGWDRLFHWDGKSWSRARLPPAEHGERIFHALWGSGPDDVWLSASNLRGNGELYRYDGDGWRGVAVPEPLPFVTLSGSGPGDLWAATSSEVWHYDGSAWTHAHTANTRLFTVWARGRGEVWVVGDSALVLQGMAAGEAAER